MLLFPKALLTAAETPPPTLAPIIEFPADATPRIAPGPILAIPSADNPSAAPTRAASPATIDPPIAPPVPIAAANAATFSIGILCAKPSGSFILGCLISFGTYGLIISFTGCIGLFESLINSGGIGCD